MLKCSRAASDALHVVLVLRWLEKISGPSAEHAWAILHEIGAASYPPTDTALVKHKDSLRFLHGLLNRKYPLTSADISMFNSMLSSLRRSVLGAVGGLVPRPSTTTVLARLKSARWHPYS